MDAFVIFITHCHFAGHQVTSVALSEWRNVFASQRPHNIGFNYFSYLEIKDFRITFHHQSNEYILRPPTIPVFIH